MKFLVALPLTLLFSCASLRNFHPYVSEYRENIVAGNCERAQNHIPLEKDYTQFFRFYQGSMGYIAYVSTLPVTVGIDLLLLGRCKFGCPTESEKSVLEALFPTSSYTYEYSKDLRCPDTSYYIQKFLEVAECYEKKADIESLKKSLNQLEYLSNEFESGPTCTKFRDFQVIKDAKKRVEKKIRNITL